LLLIDTKAIKDKERREQEITGREMDRKREEKDL